MTQHDPEAWLDLARQALAPGEADRARVLSALKQRLDLPSNDVANELARSHRHELHNVHASSTGFPLSIPSTFLRWALGTIVPLAGVAAISMVLATRNATPRTPVLRPATNTAAAVTESGLPDVLDRTIAQVKEAQEVRAPEPVPPAKEKKSQRKKCRTAKGGERPCPTVKSTETAVASAPSAPAAAPPSSLSKELAALREAQRALREGHPAHALAVLTDFEQSISGAGAMGAMQEERDAAATMARCALAQRGETKQLYETFMQRYPKSAYDVRLQRTCLPKPAR